MIKNNLKKLMKEKNVTIADLHRALGISRPTLTRMVNNESDTIRYDTIDQLCKIFMVGLNGLFSFVPFNELTCCVATVKLNKEGKCDIIRPVNPRIEIRRVEEENDDQLTDLKIGLTLTLSFDKTEFLYTSTDLKYLPDNILYVAFELKQSEVEEKEFFQFVRDTDPNFKDRVKREIADRIRKTFMLDSDIDVVIVADFMRVLEGKD